MFCTQEADGQWQVSVKSRSAYGAGQRMGAGQCMGAGQRMGGGQRMGAGQYMGAVRTYYTLMRGVCCGPCGMQGDEIC